MNMKKRCENLLKIWCESLLDLMIENTGESSLDGGILCPACTRIHGRCGDIIYPFLYIADIEKNKKYIDASKKIFKWMDSILGRPDGSFVNDSNSNWKGTTVFTVITILEGLQKHGNVLDSETYEYWSSRIRDASEYLYKCKIFDVCNVNYRISNALAMDLAGEFYGEKKYLEKAESIMSKIHNQFTENFILFGEGRPTDAISKKACRPIDLAYNMEESLQSFAEYVYRKKDRKLENILIKSLEKHMIFVMNDGAIDDSFGSRNYKWSYWGGRTSDGIIGAYLLFADRNRYFPVTAYINFKLIEKMTRDGLLTVGLHLYDMGEKTCIHHSFTHAKQLAMIMDNKLYNNFRKGRSYRTECVDTEYIDEMDSYIINKGEYSVSISGYDIQYLDLCTGHVSGGAISFLYHNRLGPIFVSSMSKYLMVEPNNMQLPLFDRHECLSQRIIVFDEKGFMYSNITYFNSHINYTEYDEFKEVAVYGKLALIESTSYKGIGSYSILYRFYESRIDVNIDCDRKFKYVLPIVSAENEELVLGYKSINIKKDYGEVFLEVNKGKLEFPYGESRIYNMVPGIQAIKLVIGSEENEIAFSIFF